MDDDLLIKQAALDKAIGQEIIPQDSEIVSTLNDKTKERRKPNFLSKFAAAVKRAIF